MESLGPKYESQILEDQGDGTYVAEVAEPEEGWTAFFVELTYDVGAPIPLKVTTNVGIVPDVFPFAQKDSTLPTSLTIRCQAPSQDVVQQIEAALDSPEMAAVAKDPQLSSNCKGSEKGVSVTVNWVPKGRFEQSARAIAGHLEKLGCDELVFQLESGRPAPLSE